ncbi:MAG: IS4 family transposase [Serpentinimonas sp.]|nr:IS4 family transposase [Serpentinimonas sp.]
MRHGRAWGLRLVSLDGSGLEVADEAANRDAFGVPGTQQGRIGYPQLRFVALLENATHVLFGVALGGYRESEVALAHQAVQHLQPGMLCLADRGFSGYPLWAAASRTGAHLLWRIAHNRKLPIFKRLEDGSCLSQIEPAAATRKKMEANEGHEAQDAAPLTLRVIDYRLPGVANAEPIYRLITTLLDPLEAPAQDLAALYQARWTIESTFAEMKTTLKGADVVLRSKLPSSGAIPPRAVPEVVAHQGLKPWPPERSPAPRGDPIRAVSSDEPRASCHARVTSRSISSKTGSQKLLNEQHWGQTTVFSEDK